MTRRLPATPPRDRASSLLIPPTPFCSWTLAPLALLLATCCLLALLRLPAVSGAVLPPLPASRTPPGWDARRAVLTHFPDPALTDGKLTASAYWCVHATSCRLCPSREVGVPSSHSRAFLALRAHSHTHPRHTHTHPSSSRTRPASAPASTAS